MKRYAYLKGYKVDEDFDFVFVKADDRNEALKKLKSKREYSENS